MNPQLMQTNCSHAPDGLPGEVALERRRHKRYPVPRGTFIILRKALRRLRNHRQMSVAEIAMVLYKSEPTMIRQVRDISFGGIGFDGSGAVDYATAELDVLMTQQGIYLHNVPYAHVGGDSDGVNGGKGTETRAGAFRFKKLDAGIKNQLADWLTQHLSPSGATGPGP